MSQDLKTINSEEFMETWGNLFQNIKTNTKYRLSFYLVFISRKAFLTYIAFFVDTSSLQIILIMFLNIFMILYIGSSYSLESLLLNRMEIFNEACIIVITLHLLFFTDWLSIELQAKCGWSMVAWTAFLVVVNLTIVIK